MSTPSIQTLITQAQQVLNLKSSNEIRATLAAVLANANVGTPLNPNLTTQQLWDEFYEIVRQPSDDIMSIITDQMMRMVFSPPAPGGAGADKQVIFNDGGVLAGDAGLVYNKTTDTLTAGSATITGAATVGTTLGVTGQSTLTGSVGIGNAPLAATRLYVRTAASTDRGFASDNGLNADFVVQYASGLTTIGAELNVPLAFKTNNIERMRLTGGNLSLANGNVVMTTSGTGIDFSAVTGGTGTATGNVLNDYEEGTWTPAYSPTTGAFTTLPTVGSGKYRKIGDTVFVWGNLRTAGTVVLGTASGDIQITGLPFTCSAASGYGTSSIFQQFNLAVSSARLGIAITASTTIATITKNLSNAGASYVQANELSTATGNFENLIGFFAMYTV
jgi:hypothetical protein